jgi:hypothetical protein
MRAHAVCCNVCGAAAFIAADLAVVRVTLDHEPSCAFLRAVEMGRARCYVEQHGYPIEAVTLESAGAA